MTGITYSQTYDAPDLRGTEDTRPWDIQDVLRRFWRESSRVLDLGCGTCAKTAWMAPLSAEFIALDPSPLMRNAASQRLAEAGGNSRVIDGMANAIPLPDGSATHLVCLLVPHETTEIRRVLAPGSLCIIETLGELDKRRLKAAFPPDDKGNRGQVMNWEYPAFSEHLRNQFSGPDFELILFSEGRWWSWLSRKQLELLLTNTNVLRGFSTTSTKDQQVLDEFEKANVSQNGIPLLNHRYLIVSRRR